MKKVYIFSLVCFGLFLINMLLIKFQLQLPVFFTSHFNDLLCLPVVLGICLYLIRKFSKDKHIKISLFSAFSLAALYSVFFEIYLPEVTKRYTADIIDVLLYFTGAFAFYLFQETGTSRKIQPNE